MPAPLSHDELVSAYQRFGPLLRRRCQSLLRQESLAEDACQNVFVKLLRDGEAYRAADSKVAWALMNWLGHKRIDETMR